MPLIPPFWFQQRQAKAEPAGENAFRVTAPQQREAVIAIRQGPDGRWAAVLRDAADGPDVAETPAEFAHPNDAWFAAFELYRNHLIT